MATVVEEAGPWKERNLKQNVDLTNGYGNYGEEPDFSDPEDYQDDISDFGKVN